MSNALDIQKEPDITFGGGVFFSVWADARGGSDMIFGARVSPSGTVLDPSGIALSGTLCGMPAVEFDGSRFLAVWARSLNVQGVFVTLAGGVQETVQIASGLSPIYAPNIAFDGVNYLVIWLSWSGAAYNIFGQRVSTSGILVGPQFTIGATSVATKPGLSFNGSHYVVSWTESYDIYAREYTTSGTPIGPAFPVSTHADMQLFNDVCAGASRYLFVWGQMTTTFDIYGNVDIVIGVDEDHNNTISKPFVVSNVITDHIYFNNHENCIIRIFDCNGRYVGMTSTDRFDCRSLAPGVYFVRIEEQTIAKIVKIR